MFKQMTISIRLAVLSLVLVLSVIGALSTFLIMTLRSDMEVLLTQQQEQSVRFVAHHINAALTQRIDLLTQVAAALPIEMLADPRRMARHLADRPGLLSLFDRGLYVLDGDGNDIAGFPLVMRSERLNLRDQEHFRGVMERGRPVVAKSTVGYFAAQPTITFATPLRDAGGNIRGVLCGEMSIVDSPVLDIIARKEIGAAEEYYLISPHDRLVVAATRPARELVRIPRDARNSIVERFIQGYEGTGTAIDSAGGQSMLVAGHFVPAAGWMVVGMLPKAAAYAPAYKATWHVLGTALAAALLIAWLVWRMLRWHLSPLERAARAMRDMALNPDKRVSIPEDGADEILAMQISFNQLQERIRSQAERVAVERHLLDTLAARVPGTLFQLQLFPDGTACFPYFSRSELLPNVAGYEDKLGKRPPLDTLLASVAPFHRLDFINAVYVSERDLSPLSLNYPASLADGATRWRHLDARPERAADGSTCWYGYASDVTEQRDQVAIVERLAYFDALTNLPNRRLLADRLLQSLTVGKRSGHTTAVCYLDLDGFKPVNDRLGHAAGDRVLIEAANRLQAAVREHDTVARIGGDEFVIVITSLDVKEESGVVVARMMAALREPFRIEDDAVCTLSASMGVAFAPNDGVDPDTLLRHADQAMYQAKQLGRDTVHYFDPT